MATHDAIREVDGGATVVCQVQPRASLTRIVGLHGDALKIQLAAPPVDDAANRELVQLFRKLLGGPASAITIRAGKQNRRKVVFIRGRTATEVAAAMS